MSYLPSYLEQIQSQFKTSAQTKLDALAVLESKIAHAIDHGVATVKNGGTIYWIGNGGSAADAQHMAAELVGRYKRERKAIRSKALTANTSNLTAIGNDYGYDMVFSRQLEAFAKPEDLLIAISTSGNSKNIIKAVELARKVGMKVVSLTGATGGKLAEISDVLLNVPSTDTARIQETHLLIEHIFCDLIEQSVM
jgi:D-sedoheptulose 7-phosphate isomerase